MPKKEKIPPPGNKKDEFTNFWPKGKWKANMVKNILEISGRNVRPTGAQIIANALMKNKWVSSLDMSHNHLSDDGATEISQLLKVNTYLLNVNLASNEITDVGGIAIASAFIPTPNPTGLPGVWNRTVSVLNLSCNHLKDDTAIALGMAIKYCRDLTKLDISYNKVGASGIKALYAALKFQPNLTIVSHHNDLGDDGVTSMCGTLRLNGVPGAHSQLNLAACDVGRLGAEAVGQLLYTNNFVQDVNLGYNTIGDLGVQAIMKGLVGKHIVRNVYLQHNLLSDESGEEIGRILEANIESLTSLVLSFNQIGEKGGCAIARGLSKNTTLQYLYLNHNRIGPVCVDALCDVIRQTKTLKFLDVRRNELKEEIRMKLSDAQKACPSSGFRMDYGAMESNDPGEEFLKKLLEAQVAAKQRLAASGGGRRAGS
jgi:Ran GTPase-activating protein (RanGAP) involved in mRNA processing and transport